MPKRSFRLRDFFKALIQKDFEIDNGRPGSHVLGTPTYCGLLRKRQNLTLALAAQYGRDNISFVAVNPGPVRTERWAGLVDAMARDMEITREEADMLALRSIPLRRIAECEVASLVAYLAPRFGAFH